MRQHTAAAAVGTLGSWVGSTQRASYPSGAALGAFARGAGPSRSERPSRDRIPQGSSSSRALSWLSRRRSAFDVPATGAGRRRLVRPATAFPALRAAAFMLQINGSRASLPEPGLLVLSQNRASWFFPEPGLLVLSQNRASWFSPRTGPPGSLPEPGLLVLSQNRVSWFSLETGPLVPLLNPGRSSPSVVVGEPPRSVFLSRLPQRRGRALRRTSWRSPWRRGTAH